MSAIFLLILAAVFSLVFSGGIPPAQATTLNEALAEAYQKNPDIEAARAELKSTEELYIQSLAGFKPSVTALADYTSDRDSDAKVLALEMTQPVFSGGRTLASLDESDNRIKAGRARVRLAEQQVLLDGVRAYMAVLRDQEIVDLRLNNETVLENQLQASRARFKLGDITKTDVSQAESRLARATADRISAQATLERGGAFFEKVIGLPPENLQKPAATAALPATDGAALDLAEKNNPALVLARHTEDVARALTRGIEGERLPAIGLTGSLGKTYNPVGAARDEETRSVGIRATLPLYTGGATVSRIRQSRQIENQLRMITQSTARSVHQSVIDAKARLAAAEAESKARQAQINAAKLALDGVRVESDVGSRTMLDLLDAQQEYLDAKVAYVGAETDRIIAAYALLAAVGSLTPERLSLVFPEKKKE